MPAVTYLVPDNLIIISDSVVTGIPAGDATSTVSGQTVSVAFQQDLGDGDIGLLAGVETTITFGCGSTGKSRSPKEGGRW